MPKVSTTMSCLSTNKRGRTVVRMDDDAFDPASFPLAGRGTGVGPLGGGRWGPPRGGRPTPAGDTALSSPAPCHWSPMYLNAEYARAHDHPDAVVNPMLALCVAVGLSVEDLSEAG